MASNDDLSKMSDPSDDEATSSSDVGSDSGEPEQVEWLATTRSKRSTAGNRMKAMLANEGPAEEDSDLELLFAEDEDDAGFSDNAKEDASDVQMDSSSDDEDQDEVGDDLEGEKELERQAREKKSAQRKRKAQEAIPAKFRKKVRIEQAATGTDSASPRSSAPPPPGRPPPRPKKKSERLSWIPTVADMPTRASERKTTRISKQLLHQKMVKDEVRRKKQLERMEKNAKRLEALKKPPMTQEERLAEAALVEKRNSKSLNRWEAAEKQREEERLRKIAALNNRKLDGPVVTFWSGIQELQEGQLKHVGNLVSMEEKAPRKKRQSAAAALAAKEQGGAKVDQTPKVASPTEPAAGTPGDTTPIVKPEAPEAPEIPPVVPPPESGYPEPLIPQESASHPSPTSIPQQPAMSTVATPATVAPPPLSHPPDVSHNQQPHASAVLAAPVLAPPVGVPPPMLGNPMPMLGYPGSSAKSNCLAPPNTSHTPSPLSLPPTVPGSADMAMPHSSPAVLAVPAVPAAPSPAGPVSSTPALPTLTIPATSSALNTPSPNHLTLPPPPLPSTLPLQPTQGKSRPPSKGPDTPKEPPPEPPREGKVTRSCIILQNFDENAIKDRQVQTQILFGRKMNKLAKPAHPPTCVITNRLAKYRDPKTGLPYADSHAYKEIQHAIRGEYKYSSLIGAYVGTGNLAARGVPARFLDPTKPRSTPVAPPPPPTTNAVLVPIEGPVQPTQGQGQGNPRATSQFQGQAQAKAPQPPAQIPAQVPVPAQAPLQTSAQVPPPAPIPERAQIQNQGAVLQNKGVMQNPAVPHPQPTQTPIPTQVPGPQPNQGPVQPPPPPLPVAEARLVPIENVNMGDAPAQPNPVVQLSTG